MKTFTTLNKILYYFPCEESWNKLLKKLNKTDADDEPLDLMIILETNGVEACLLAKKTTENNEKNI